MRRKGKEKKKFKKFKCMEGARTIMNYGSCVKVVLKKHCIAKASILSLSIVLSN